MRNQATRLAAIMALGATLLTAGAETAYSGRLAFTQSGNEFLFDTGVVRGKLRPLGKALGLASVVHIPSGVMLDRGDQGHGLFSHYRVFTTGQRYGHGAWDWPSTARRLDDGAVEVRWAAETNRPFEMRAVYRWDASDTLELDTIVTAQQDLPKFESFLASYFADRFTNALVYVAEAPGTGRPGFMAAEKSQGVWQMFPRDAAALTIANDGRWAIETNPVQWVAMPALAQPIGVRRDPSSGVAVAALAKPSDCFAVLTPFQTEAHYSLYLSLFGRDVKAGETATARTRLVILAPFSEDRILQKLNSLAGRKPLP